MSFKPEVRTGSDPKFYGNALCFATREEALASGKCLMNRWFAVVDYRAIESTDAVNYRHEYGVDVRLDEPGHCSTWRDS